MTTGRINQISIGVWVLPFLSEEKLSLPERFVDDRVLFVVFVFCNTVPISKAKGRTHLRMACFVFWDGSMLTSFFS